MDDPPKHTLHLLYHSFKSPSSSLVGGAAAAQRSDSQSITASGSDDLITASSTNTTTTTATTTSTSLSPPSNSTHISMPNENESFETSLLDISEQITSSGFSQPSLLASLIVESAVVSNEHLALLLEDGRVCRIAYLQQQLRLQTLKLRMLVRAVKTQKLAFHRVQLRVEAKVVHLIRHIVPMRFYVDPYRRHLAQFQIKRQQQLPRLLVAL